MKKQYYQSQYILNKVYNNKTDIIKTTLNTSQDYLNAVFDSSKDALRVNIDGGSLPVVDDVNELPNVASQGQLCPVFNSEKGVLDYYQWKNNEWVYLGSTIKSDEFIKPDEQIALTWLTDHLDQIKEVTDFDYIVYTEDVVLSKNSNIVEVQGQRQNIDDDLNGDNDETTPYRIDFIGYVLSVSTFSDNNALVPDRYYTRITYESAQGGLGTSHIYLNQDEYDYFANLDWGKNIIKVFYITNSTTSPIKRIRYTLNPDKTITDADNNIIDIKDLNDEDGDSESTCKISCAGYVLGIQTYASSEASVMDKYYTKMVYESDGIHAGKSTIYMDDSEYDYFSNLSNNKNIMDIYYVATVFPASITISETQFQIPVNNVGYVVIDASGNVHNIEDDLDKDNDTTTHIKLTMNGYVLDVDGYYNENDTIKKRLITKMSYIPELDITDIYLDKDYYDVVSNLGNSRNIISVYTLGAGIGIDASRISMTDSVLDETSEKAIQNKTVANAIKELQNRIAELQSELDSLK